MHRPLELCFFFIVAVAAVIALLRQRLHRRHPPFDTASGNVFTATQRTHTSLNQWHTVLVTLCMICSRDEDGLLLTLATANNYGGRGTAN